MKESKEGNGTTNTNRITTTTTSVLREQNVVTDALAERLEEHNTNRVAIQDKLHDTCNELRKQVDMMEDRINGELQKMFTMEDSRLQAALSELRAAAEDKVSEAVQRAKAKLLVRQTYELVERGFGTSEKLNVGALYELRARREVATEWFGENSAPKLSAIDVSGGLVRLRFAESFDAEQALTECKLGENIRYRISFQRADDSCGEAIERYLTRESDGSALVAPMALEEETNYTAKVKAELKGKESEWSREIRFTTPGFSGCCAWKECPCNDVTRNNYSVDKKNPRVATKIINSFGWCTLAGSTPLPQNKATSWSIRILKSQESDGNGINVGVAPSDIDQSVYIRNFESCGWYLNCYGSTLYSGPPHNYRNKEMD